MQPSSLAFLASLLCFGKTINFLFRNRDVLKAKTARQPFGALPLKKLPIPTFIDEYNYFTNRVDL